ncbi:MAG: acyl-CoA thioesterase [Xanthomonadales bacterium]|nr:acyl-CoA thioesterase [Xanthomonadales bacterium]
MIPIFEYQHRVSPEDIDDLGHAGNYHYVRWLQHATVAHSTANGWAPERYNELGAGWVVRSHHIEYLKPALEGDDLIIRTWVENMKPATSLRRYEICLRDGTLLARAETEWAFVNYTRQKAVRIPPEVASSFEVATPAPG